MTPASDRRALRASVSAILAMAASLMPSFLTGAVVNEMGGDLGFSESGLGVAIAFFFLLAAVTSPHAGSLTDRWGPTRSLRIATTLSGASLLGTAVLARSYWSLLVMLAIGALGLTIAGPGTKVMVRHGVPESRHGFAFGLQSGAVPLSSLLCGLAVPTIALWAGWRWAFVAGAVVALIGFLLAPAVASPSPAGKVGVRQPAAIDYGPLIRLGLAVALGSAAATSVASFFVPAATRLSISEGTAGLLLAFSSAVVIAARILAGLAADRSRRDPLATVMVMMGVSTLGYVVAASSSQWLMPLGALFAMGAGWSWSGLVVHAVVRHYRDTPGAATGITSGAQNVGGVVGPVLFGLLAEHVSYASAFLAVAACAALASFAASAGRRRLRGAAAPVSA